MTVNKSHFHKNTGTGQCPVWLYIYFYAPFLAMAMIEQAHHCSSGLTKTLFFETFDIMFCLFLSAVAAI